MRNSGILSPLAVCIPAVAVCAIGVSAQTITGGPISGAVFDTSTHSIRAILGVPGAAYLGSAAASTWDLAVPSPDGKRALALRGSSVSVIPDLSHPDTATAIGAVIEAADRIVWSADSSAAVLFCARSNQLQRVTGLRGTPAIQAALNLAGAGAITGWGISPDGNSLAYSTAAAGTGNVYLVSGSNAPIRVGSFTDPGALTFSHDGASLFVFDRASASIARVQVSSGAVMDSFAATPSGAVAEAPAPATDPSEPGFARHVSNVADARAVRASARRIPARTPSAKADLRDLAVTDDGALLLAIAGQSLCVYDLAGHSGDHCNAIDVNADSIHSIAPGVFVLNYPRASGLPVWLWDRSAGAMYFVPSGRSAANVSN